MELEVEEKEKEQCCQNEFATSKSLLGLVFGGQMASLVIDVLEL
jgi:hypothetical protein